MDELEYLWNEYNLTSYLLKHIDQSLKEQPNNEKLRQHFRQVWDKLQMLKNKIIDIQNGQ